jgi:hypothetical protein
MPTSTYTPIATTTLGSAVASYTFSSIPSGYTDLVLVASTQATSSGQGQSIELNSDTGSNYSATILRGNGSSAVSARITSVQAALLSNIAEPPTSSFGVYIANFQNYSNATTYKSILCRSNNAAAGTEAIVNLWRSTAAITSIKIAISGGNFNTGSTFTLYGILAA